MKRTDLLCIMIIMMLFTGCASYRADSLPVLSSEYVQTYDEVEGMRIGCKAYTLKDCYNYLDRNVIAKGYQPVQFTFYNRSDRIYLFSTKGISLTCASPEEVAKMVHTSTAWRIAGYSIGGMLFFPISSPLFIPAIVDGIRSSDANASLDADFAEKAKDQFEIRPNSFLTALIFVRKAYYAPIFDLALLNKETGIYETITLSAIQ